MKKPVDIEKNKEKYLQFVESRKNLILSLIDGEGKPFTSYAPFVKKDGKLYIYISQIAEHYGLMEKNEFVDAFLLADESATVNKFATERARWTCTSINLGNEGHEDIFELFNTAHGSEMLDVLRGLDFSLFELTPLQGRYVVGFGMAFDTDINANVFTHVVVDKKKDAED
ncbi:heme iron utilization protein [Psychrobacillus sp. AK 1817]|uniref:pyridoxamine 5'-phosphate oxidase family protein n=1 Tax=Psychrobacillus sp. AK 1817 TaxID=2303505 RepID=UPI0012452B11|nr:pyridoxamine 5'-phosphate oxidase family protein [Psychrobacillus sp. AK 1817]QEY22467.1 heme iron utilization protein [Psychrobacillus sp. AK 1817]